MSEQQKTPAFTPIMSKRSRSIETLTRAQVFDRYIVKGQGDLSDEFYKELNVRTANGDLKYPYITSLFGDNVNLFGTILIVKNKPYLPEGYKLNLPNILIDVENILIENRSKVKEAIDKQEITPFTRALFNYISQKISSSYTLNDDMTFSIDN